jgi:hypothetical protein
MEHIDFADYADMAFHNIEEVSANGIPLLRVKALIFHSAIVAEHVDLYPELDSVHILIKVAIASHNKSGLVELYIPIPERVKAVTFGKSKTVLWKRGSKTLIVRTKIAEAEHLA